MRERRLTSTIARACGSWNFSSTAIRTFPGLNLSWEVLEAQAMHSKRPDAPEVKPYLGSASRFWRPRSSMLATAWRMIATTSMMRSTSGLITADQLHGVPFWNFAVERVQKEHQTIHPEQLQPTVIRKLIDWQVLDLLDSTRQNLRRHESAT